LKLCLRPAGSGQNAMLPGVLCGICVFLMLFASFLSSPRLFCLVVCAAPCFSHCVRLFLDRCFQLAWDPEPCPQIVKAATRLAFLAACFQAFPAFRAFRVPMLPCARLLFCFCFVSSFWVLFCGIVRSSGMHEVRKREKKKRKRTGDEGPPEALQQQGPGRLFHRCLRR
jgi:hypothetical protein